MNAHSPSQDTGILTQLKAPPRSCHSILLSLRWSTKLYAPLPGATSLDVSNISRLLDTFSSPITTAMSDNYWRVSGRSVATHALLLLSRFNYTADEVGSSRTSVQIMFLTAARLCLMSHSPRTWNERQIIRDDVGGVEVLSGTPKRDVWHPRCVGFILRLSENTRRRGYGDRNQYTTPDASKSTGSETEYNRPDRCRGKLSLR